MATVGLVVQASNMDQPVYTCPFCGCAAHKYPLEHECPAQEFALKESQEQFDTFREAFLHMDSEECRFPGPISAEDAMQCLFWVAHNRYINGIGKMIEIQMVKQFIRENTPGVST